MIVVRGHERFNSMTTSIPSLFGMKMSVMTTSGGFLWHMAMPALPSRGFLYAEACSGQYHDDRRTDQRFIVDHENSRHGFLPNAQNECRATPTFHGRTGGVGEGVTSRMANRGTGARQAEAMRTLSGESR